MAYGTTTSWTNDWKTTVCTLCALSACFLVSRLVLRAREKEHLKISDYFLLLAMPSLLTGVAVLQSILDDLLAQWPVNPEVKPSQPKALLTFESRLVAAIELLWLAIYLVKGSFLAQFKFYEPLYAHVSPSLTRHYWLSVGICGISFLFTLIVPIVLCPTPPQCRYATSENTAAWEVALSALDIVTNLLVISIPVTLVCLANFTLSNAIINTSFKSLSVFMIVITACRIAFQFDRETGQINYRSFTLWLVIEVAAAIAMGSISSYRTAVLNFYATRKRRQSHKPMHLGVWITLGAQKANGATDDNAIAH